MYVFDFWAQVLYVLLSVYWWLVAHCAFCSSVYARRKTSLARRDRIALRAAICKQYMVTMCAWSRFILQMVSQTARAQGLPPCVHAWMRFVHFLMSGYRWHFQCVPFPYGRMSPTFQRTLVLLQYSLEGCDKVLLPLSDREDIKSCKRLKALVELQTGQLPLAEANTEKNVDLQSLD